MAPAAEKQPPTPVERGPVKFDAAFIERRLQEHKQMQKQKLQELCDDILDEIAGEIRVRSRSARRMVAHVERPR